MSAKFRIEGGGGGLTASVTQDERHSPGLVAYTHSLDDYDFSLVPLSNPDFGVNMAIDPTAIAPTTLLIHDGGDIPAWTGSNISGSGFDFASTAQAFDGTRSIDGTGSSNNNIAGIVAPSPIALTDYSALTMAMYITSFPSTGTKDVTLQWFSAGAPVGNELSVKAYVSTITLNSWQTLNISLSDFGLTGAATFNELRIKTVDSGQGTPPNYYMDAIKLVEAGGAAGVASYKFSPNAGENYSLLRLRIRAWNSGKTALAPDEFFGLPALTGGFELILRNKRRVFISLIAREIWDLGRAPNVTTRTDADGSTGAYFIVDFDIPLEHMLVFGDAGTTLEVRIKDDLTGLDRLETSLHLAKLR